MISNIADKGISKPSYISTSDISIVVERSRSEFEPGLGMALQDCSIVFSFSLYDTMCYDYEHGASDTCKATGCVFIS